MKCCKTVILIHLFLLSTLLHYSHVYAADDAVWSTYKNNIQRSGFSSSASPTTNHLLWEFETGGGVESSPIVDNNIVFVNAGDCTLYAIDLFSGSLKWNFTYDSSFCLSQYSSPAAFNEKIILNTAYNGIFCLDQLSGEQLWQYEVIGDSMESSPLVADNKVFVTLWNTDVIALNAETGDLIWRYYTGGSNQKASPAFHDGKIYVPTYGGRIWVLDANTGAEIHKIELSGHIQTPVIFEGKLFVSTSVNNGNRDGLYALDLATLSVLWSKKIGTYKRTSPSVGYGKVFIGGEQLRAYDIETGELLWYYDKPMEADPAIADGKVFANINRQLISFDQETGQVLWQDDIGYSTSSPSISNGMVLVGSDYPSKVFSFYAYQHDVAVSAFDIPFPINPGQKVIVSVNVSNEGLSDESNLTIDLMLNGAVIDSKTIALLSSFADQQITFEWTPPLAHVSCDLSVNVQVNGEDNYTANNSVTRQVAVGGKSLFVPSGFNTIQAAIDYADPGDTIEIAAGSYAESLVIEKSHIKLLAQAQAQVIINGDDPITITADYCELSGIQIENGPSHTSGGGVVIKSSYNTISNCTIKNNGNGILLLPGGVSILSVNNVIENCLITMNTNNGIHIKTGVSNTLVKNCVFTQNSSSSYKSSAIAISGNGNQVVDCDIQSNIDNGITLLSATNSSVLNTTIKSNGLTGIQLLSGYHGDSTMNLVQGCTIENNNLGMSIAGSPDNVFKNNRLSSNHYNLNIGSRAYYQDMDKSNLVDGKPIWFLVNKSNMMIDGNIEEIGMVVLADCSEMYLKNATLSGNYQGVIMHQTTDSIIENCNIRNNYDGIYMGNSSLNVIKKCIVSDNQDGIRMYGYVQEGLGNKIEGCEFRSNSHSGVFMDNSSNGNEVLDSEFAFNNIGIYTENSSSHMVKGLKIHNNIQGIVFGRNSFYGTVVNCDIYNNTEDGIKTYSSQYIANNTIYGNSGFGIVASSTSQIINSILWNNGDNLNSPDLNVSFSNVKGGYAGNGNINKDPMFKNSANGDFGLKSDSPCIDAGTIPDIPLMQLDGDNDLLSLPDMGAHEFLGKPDIFGLSFGNRFAYQTRVGNYNYSTERNVILYDKISYNVPVYVVSYQWNGEETIREFYGKTENQVKLWGMENKNTLEEIDFVSGLTKYWCPMSIGDHQVSNTLVSGPYSIQASLDAHVIEKEMITINEFEVDAYKIKYVLKFWGANIDEFQTTFFEWFVPHVGVVKYQDDESEDRLLSFSIGSGFIDSTKSNMIYYNIINNPKTKTNLQPILFLLLQSTK